MARQPTSDCDPGIYENGRTVCVLAGTSTAIEAVVVRVREEMKIALDWHYVGGRACVLTTEPEGLDAGIYEAIKMALPIMLSASPSGPAASGDR